MKKTRSDTPESAVKAMNRRLTAAINRTTHALCRAEYPAIRAELLFAIEQAQAAGATDGELLALLADRARYAPKHACGRPVGGGENLPVRHEGHPRIQPMRTKNPPF